jgi:hyperosmotically inducible periplasmic protein
LAFYRIPNLYLLKRKNMNKIKLLFASLTLLAIGATLGCSGASAKSPDVSDNIRNSLDQAGFKNVSVKDDRDKGVVTLGGNVTSENAKSQAETLAKSLAGAQVVADEVAVIPVGVEEDAKAVNSDLDKGIEKNLDAALIQNKMHDNVKYEVKNGVITLSGEVNSEGKRDSAETVATNVPNVKQVVNDLQIKEQKASSSQ